MRRILLTAFLIAAVMSAVPTAAAGVSNGGCDFNGDSFDDLAVAVPRGNGGLGEVSVIYGSDTKLSAVGNQLWTLPDIDVAGANESDQFAQLIECGDFNGDTYDDLAISHLGDTSGAWPGEGSVIVLFGSAAGLSNSGAQRMHLATPGIKGDPFPSSSFGLSLAAGDFNDDGYDDLAIGTDSAADAVHVLRGSANGLSVAGDQVWTRATPGVKGQKSLHDHFGRGLQAADFNGDGYSDLAIGATGGVTIKGEPDVGSMNILYGSARGLTAAGDQLWHLGKAGVAGPVQAFAGYGSVMAAGDFNDDGYGDIAVGIPNFDVSGEQDAGAVSVMYGTSAGLQPANSQFWHRDKAGVNRGVGQNHGFGTSIAVGDFNKDGHDDLLVGVPGDDKGDTSGFSLFGGSVHILWGGPSGLVETGDMVFDQDKAGIKETFDREDSFGRSVSTGDYDGNNAFDLAIAVPGESVPPFPDDNDSIGAISVIYGTTQGPKKSDQLWKQGEGGLLGVQELTEGFGLLDNSLPN